MLEDEIGKGQPYKTLDIPEDYHSVEVMLALSSAVDHINKESLDLRHLQHQLIKKGKMAGHIFYPFPNFVCIPLEERTLKVYANGPVSRKQANDFIEAFQNALEPARRQGFGLSSGNNHEVFYD